MHREKLLDVGFDHSKVHIALEHLPALIEDQGRAHGDALLCRHPHVSRYSRQSGAAADFLLDRLDRSSDRFCDFELDTALTDILRPCKEGFAQRPGSSYLGIVPLGEPDSGEYNATQSG